MLRLALIVLLVLLAAVPALAEGRGAVPLRAGAAGQKDAVQTVRGGTAAVAPTRGAAFDGVTARMRLAGRRCRRGAVVALADGRRAGVRRVGTRWRTHRLRARGTRSFGVRLRAPARCSLLVGRFALLPAGGEREAAAPAPAGDAPAEAPAPAPAPARTAPVVLGAAVDAASLDGAPGYAGTFLANFSSLTAENEMKMEALQPRPGQYDFKVADRLVAFAKTNGKRIHGHVLIWNQQAPRWLSEASALEQLTGEGAPYSRDELLAILRDHVSTVTARYAEDIGHWDVVNEALTPDGSYKPGLWLDGIGPEYVTEAFRAARAADPDAKLCYNEIGAEVAGPLADAVFGLVADLRREGLIDCVGFQMHVSAATPPSQDAVRQNLERFATLGVELHVSEMDVDVSKIAGDDATRFAEQARIFGLVARACHAVAACTRFTTWGFTDASTWLGETARPLPFDGAFQPKPAWNAILAGLSGS